MPDGEDRVAPQHARPCILHDLLDPGAHRRFVAVDRAAAAGGLFLLEGTNGQSFTGIGGKGTAFRAKTFLGAVVSATVERNHGLNGSSLECHSGFVALH